MDLRKTRTLPLVTPPVGALCDTPSTILYGMDHCKIFAGFLFPIPPEILFRGSDRFVLTALAFAVLPLLFPNGI